MFNTIQYALIIFGLIAAVFWWIQLGFAHIVNRRQKKISLPDDYRASISVVIPVFNELQERIDRTIWSVLNQRNVNLDIIVVDDGSTMKFDIPKHPSVSLIRLENNEGKRVAQMHGIDKAKYDWVATVDSDTILDDGALLWLHFTCTSQKIDAATGSVFLSNEQENLLTKITSCMYWFACFQERASQSFFGAVTCCSGALSIYRKSVILENKEDYLNQKFFGLICHAGDDRQLTNIFLLSGRKVGWSANAVAWTHSPEQLIPFLKQQLRWIRSHISSLYYLFGKIKNWKFWPTFFTAKLVFKYIYVIVLYFSFIAVSAYTMSFYPLLIALASILVIAGIKSCIACVQTKKWKFLYLLIYTIFTFFVFNLILIYGIFTPTKIGWLTRKSKQQV